MKCTSVCNRTVRTWSKCNNNIVQFYSLCLTCSFLSVSIASGATGTPLKLGWNRGGVRSKKTCNISETVQDRTKVYYDGLIGIRIYALSIGTKYQYQRPWATLNGVTAQSFQVPTIISGTVKATDFKFGLYIHGVHTTKTH